MSTRSILCPKPVRGASHGLAGSFILVEPIVIFHYQNFFWENSLKMKLPDNFVSM
jgi:hypothetical protein